jgi:outer membrane protein insertion porin family
VIRREMKISERRLFNNTNSRSAAPDHALGFFETVNVSTKRGSSDEFVEVNVEVSERPTGTFQIGAGFSSVENFIAQAQISQNNLFGRGQTLALQAQLSSLRQLFLLRFVEPYFLDTADVRVRPTTRRASARLRNPRGTLTWGYPLVRARAFTCSRTSASRPARVVSRTSAPPRSRSRPPASRTCSAVA